MYLAGRELPPSPLVLDAAVIEQIVHQIGHGNIEDRIFAAHKFASLLEAEESKYRALVGDPHSNPNLRSHYTVGKLLNAIKDEEDLYDAIVDDWISSRNASIEQNVAGLRLLLACLDCWLFQYPLTEESLVEKLGHWAVEGLEKAAVLGDKSPKAMAEMLQEARQTYAMGLLGIALANEEYADKAVQTPLVTSCCSYLQRTALRSSNHNTSAQAAGQAGPASNNTQPVGQSATAAGAQQQQTHLQDGLISAVNVPAGLAAAAQQSPEGSIDDVSQLRLKRLLGVIRCLTCTGEYVEALAPFLTHQGLESCLVLLRAWHGNGILLNEVLQIVCSFLAHRRFGELLVEQGGVQLLLALPRTPHTSMGLSLALFGLASLPLAFERACALPQPVPQDLSTAGLSLLAASSDAARKNAALFFDAAVHYPVLLECFDAADGLHRLLYPLRHVVQLLQSGDAAQLRSEKQVAYHASRALLQYIRAHLVSHMLLLQRRLRDHNQSAAAAAAPAPHKPINTSATAVEDLIAALATDAKLAEAFVRTRWPLLDRVSEQHLVSLMLELVRAMPGEERYFSDISLYCLEVLQLITLSPLPRRDIVSGSSNSSRSRSGGQPGSHQPRSDMSVLLHAASTGNATPFYGLADPEVIATALQVICNCVTAPQSLAYLLPAAGTAAGAAAAVEAAAAAAEKSLEVHQTPATAELAAGGDHTAPPSLELGPSAVHNKQGWRSLGEALEAGYAAARQAVRSSNGIRVLLTLLQSRQHFAPTSADRVRALACCALLGLAKDASIRHILTKLQVGKLLAELVREPAAHGGAGAGSSSSRRDANAAADGAAAGTTAGALWQERFRKAALELIAITTSSGSSTGKAEQRLAAAAATDAAAPALLKIERAAIAAATPITYQPQELLLLMYEHLKASGLHSAAAALAKEAGLASSSRSHHHQQQHGSSAAAAGGMSPAIAAAAAPSPTAAAAGCANDGQQPIAAAGFAAAAAAAAHGSAAAVYSRGGGGGSSSGLELSAKERRRTLSLGPALLSHTCQKDSTQDSEHRQSQKQQQQQQRGSNASKPASASAVAADSDDSTAAAAAGTSARGRMSPPLSQQIIGSKRRASTAAAAAAAKTPAAAANAFETPAGKRQAVGSPERPRLAVNSGSATPAAAAAAKAAVIPLLSPTAAETRTPGPIGSIKSLSSRAAAAAAKTPASLPGSTAAPAATDAEYLQSLAGPQQQQSGVFHTQSLPAATQGTSHGPNQGSVAPAVKGQGFSTLASVSPRVLTADRDLGFSGTPSPTSWAGFAVQETPISGSLANFKDALGFSTPRQNGGLAGTPVLGPAPAPAGSQNPAGAAATAAAATTAAAETGSDTGSAVVNPLLSKLPSRQLSKTAGALQRRFSGGLDQPHRMTPIAEAVPEPKPLPLHVQVAAREVMTGPPVNSRLGGIVSTYLKQQHRAACLSSAQPVSVVPPVSLLKPYTLPTASRLLQAPANVTLRRARQELFGGFGGRGGSSATRRFVWSRFRLTQTLRDDGPLLTACTFLRGFDLLVSGTASGELKVHDAYSGENIGLIDAHTAPVNLLQASQWPGGTSGDQLLLSSSRSEVLLWRADSFDTGPLYSWNGLTRGRFNPSSSQLIAVAVGSSPRQARVYDTTTGEVIATLDEAAAAAAAAAASSAAGAPAAGGGAAAGTPGEFVRGTASACFSPSGELILWGATLWDPRVPVPLHTFDQLSSGGTGGCFHPGGSEIILNSEVWDLRNRKLLRSVPTLDGTSITFNSSGDVLCAWLRRPADDSMAALLQPKRRRHALATSFISMDARSYTEVANVQVDRAVLDLCLDPSDSYLAAVAVDIGGGLEGSVASSVRLYEVGRQRPVAGEDSDSDGAGEESEEEDEENEDSGDAGGLQALIGPDTDIDGEIADGDSDADDAEGDEGEDLDLDEGMTLEDALADMYEEAIAAGVDPDELDAELSEEEFEGGIDDIDDEELLEALGEGSSEYITDEEAG